MSNDKVSVAIIGASGYSGEELLRLLLRHPRATVSCVTSRQYAGQPLGVVFPRFAEASLTFSMPDAADVARQAQVAFLALPHGLAAEFAEPLVKAGVRVIDISADFRLRDPEAYRTWYKTEHPAPRLLAKAVYGLPEMYREQLRTAQLVACPGCYPTSVILPLKNLLAEGLIDPCQITVSSMSGVSGAGRKVDLPYIFPECNESVRPYSVVGHRHIPEIEQELTVSAGGRQVVITFVPHLVPVNRGIHTTVVAAAAPGASAQSAMAAWHRAYDGEPFVRVLGEGQLADTKHVTMTNMCEIGCAWDARTGRLVISSAIDNLTKGAAGQAVQCMNIACGFDETAGLL